MKGNRVPPLVTTGSERGVDASCVAPFARCFDFFGAAAPSPRSGLSVFGGPTGGLTSVFEPCGRWLAEPFTEGATGAASDDCCAGAPGGDPAVDRTGSGCFDVSEPAFGPCSCGTFDGISSGVCGAGSGGASPPPVAGGPSPELPPADPAGVSGSIAPSGWAGASSPGSGEGPITGSTAVGVSTAPSARAPPVEKPGSTHSWHVTISSNAPRRIAYGQVRGRPLLGTIS